MISKELTAASTKPLILALLTEGENYGYALIQRVRELSREEMNWTEGMLYPVLHRLEQEGLIESEWKQGESGRSRKYYRVSRSGRTALRQEKEQWLSVHNVLNHLWQTS